MTNNLTPQMTMLLQFGLLSLVYSSPNAKMRGQETLFRTKASNEWLQRQA